MSHDIKKISKSLYLLHNLVNAAKFHKKHCNEQDCGVTLNALHEIAQILLFSVTITESNEAEALVKSIDWY